MGQLCAGVTAHDNSTQEAPHEGTHTHTHTHDIVYTGSGTHRK